MRKLLVLPIVAVLALSCQPKTASLTPSKEILATSPKATGSKLITKEALAKGKTIFENSCAKCHDLPNPAEFSDAKWIRIMNSMAPKSNLNKEQSELVYNYVTSKN